MAKTPETVIELAVFRAAREHADKAGLQRDMAMQMVRAEQATGRSGWHSVQIIERLTTRPLTRPGYWSEV